eukprot:scaffold251393_cov56-Attheya_sp.AAC.1
MKAPAIIQLRRRFTSSFPCKKLLWGIWTFTVAQWGAFMVTELKEYDDMQLVMKRAATPYDKHYHRPEMDVSSEVDASMEASYYQSHIGILRGMVEIGRVDIITEVSMLASQLALPRWGHLDVVFHMYA